jgi:peptidylprolyl isomerase
MHFRKTFSHRIQPLASMLAMFCALACGGSSAGDNDMSDAVTAATAEDGIYAVFHTSMGEVACRLHYEKAPITVANFIGLAIGEKEFKDPTTLQMVKRPFYDGLIFHRVIKSFMVQGGCPLGNGRGGPGYQFMDEFDPSLRHDKPGVLSMANSGPSTNGSQFFITHVPTPHLDDKHTIFGQTVAGQDIIDAMADVPMQASTPLEPIKLVRVEVLRRGAAAENFDWTAIWADQEAAKERKRAEQAEQEIQKMEELAKTLGFDMNGAKDGSDGLRYVVRQEGTGAQPTKGQTISVHYTGYLLDGTKFDSSVDRDEPYQTPIGVAKVIRGWDISFQDMKVGEKRVLIIPSDLAYGARGYPPVIPANATLVFDVELLGIK